MASLDLDFDWYDLEGAGVTDLLDFLKIPHYSNEHTSKTETRSYEVRLLAVPYEDEEDEDEDEDEEPVSKIPELFLIVWTGERPTDQQVIDGIVSLDG
jgi:hypothetical protein